MALPPGLAKAPAGAGLGGELKNTFCLVKDGQAILSQHMGDLEDALRLARFRAKPRSFQRALCASAEGRRRRSPSRLSLDASSGAAVARDAGLPLVDVQHHHAHIASAMAENGVEQGDGLVLGIALDGLGLGDDGTLWGGEFLLADYAGYRRVGTFKPVAMPGGTQGDARALAQHARAYSRRDGLAGFAMNFVGTPLHDYLQAKPVDTIASMIGQGVNSPAASSCGRLFDAVAAAVGICRDEIFHEGEAAMRLEALVDRRGLGRGR